MKRMVFVLLWATMLFAKVDFKVSVEPFEFGDVPVERGEALVGSGRKELERVDRPPPVVELGDAHAASLSSPRGH